MLRRLSPKVRISNLRQRIDDLTGRLDALTIYNLKYERQRVDGFLARLSALDPEAVLARGYAIVRQHNSAELGNFNGPGKARSATGYSVPRWANRRQSGRRRHIIGHKRPSSDCV